MRMGYYFLLVMAAVSFTPAITAPAWAWGGKGHIMQAQIALGALPDDVPLFFRQSGDEMLYLINEPDRWRSDEQQASLQAEWCDHGFKWENAIHPMPLNRVDYIEQLTQRGLLPKEGNKLLNGFGCSPYAIQEWSERLTAAFRRWRAMADDTPAQITQKRTQEHVILFMAGVLGHYVTDSSQPLHVTKYNGGWPDDLPNPTGYKAEKLHSRFESAYVNKAINAADVAALVTGRPRLISDWLQDTLPYIQSANGHTRQIFIWDSEAPFGSGREPPKAKAFTAALLADGARMTRDYWYSAWVRSGQPIEGK